MKRIIAGFLAILTLVFCLTSCGNKTISGKIDPPEMTVVLGNQRVKTLRGSTHWEHLLTKKEWHKVYTEEKLPMMRSKDETPCLEYSESAESNVVTMEFDIPPIDFYVNCYKIDAWGDITAEYYELDVSKPKELGTFTFELMDYEGIYEVWARWYTNEGNKQQGDIYYSFYTKKVS